MTGIVDSWRYGGKWWQGEPGRTYYRVSLATHEEVVIYREDQTHLWVLALLTD
ncbi:MAG TPA: hypothetical protein VF171_05220 [Trueperaceae bacterium]